MAKQIHIVPNGNMWSVREAGRTQPISNHRTQSNAIGAGRPLAIRTEAELVIHRPNGQIRDKDSYGLDPNPPKDRKY